MEGWKANLKNGFSCNNPVFIEGLPGIGNVGKIVIDYIIDSLKAKKIGSFFSYDLPNSVFVTEKNLVQLPSIDLYHAKCKTKDFLFLTGDAQPSNERASYELSVELLKVINKFKGSQIITLGGIGLNEIPQNPKVYVTGNNPLYIKEFKKLGVKTNVYGMVGPIIGVSGLLLGLADKKEMQAVALLGETFGHPMYIGLKEARQVLVILKKKYGFQIDLKELDEEIKAIEEELEEDEISLDGEPSKKQSKKLRKLKKYQDMNYIG